MDQRSKSPFKLSYISTALFVLMIVAGRPILNLLQTSFNIPFISVGTIMLALFIFSLVASSLDKMREKRAAENQPDFDLLYTNDDDTDERFEPQAPPIWSMGSEAIYPIYPNAPSTSRLPSSLTLGEARLPSSMGALPKPSQIPLKKPDFDPVIPRLAFLIGIGGVFGSLALSILWFYITQ